MRSTIERCFGTFTVRWGIFQRALSQEPDRVAQIVGSCIRLHNLCMQAKDTTVLAGSGAFEYQDEVAEQCEHVSSKGETALRSMLVRIVEE
eukprot:9472164-Pyramimonas_sp.AAC.1